MSPREQQLMMLGVLSTMTEQQRATVIAAADKIRAAVTEAGDLGLFAIGMVGIEVQIKAEQP
jgi:hypothetical protein